MYGLYCMYMSQPSITPPCPIRVTRGKRIKNSIHVRQQVAYLFNVLHIYLYVYIYVYTYMIYRSMANHVSILYRWSI